MFFDAVIVFILFVLAPMAVFWGIRQLRESGPAASGEAGGEALRRSELDRIVRDAVLDATAPLEARIDELEQEVLLGGDRIAPGVLAAALDDAPEASGEKAARPRRGRA